MVTAEGPRPGVWRASRSKERVGSSPTPGQVWGRTWARDPDRRRARRSVGPHLSLRARSSWDLCLVPATVGRSGGTSGTGRRSQRVKRSKDQRVRSRAGTDGTDEPVPRLIDAVDAAIAEVHAPRGARIARIGRRPVKAGNRRPEDRVDARCDVAASRRCPIVDAAGGVNVILLPESSSLVGGRDRDCRERVRLIDGRAGRVTPICDP